ncbi:hypothetical protein P3T35_002350 [Kitasatospora sp. GP30]|uniref:lantibiotic dehydratase n=1 Tax=Kitasatospora sp. GP30 TaxID=3035084 RepID=UPI000C712249|nr:lantibiotic dehydratase [Kitasatospora sp. GP30]MDH6140342.1 hypothetical protein [Kitasatospora sp. GP30]
MTHPPHTASPADPPPLVPLGSSGWRAWPDAMLRSAGFPAAELDALRAPDLAAAADAALGLPDQAEAAQHYEKLWQVAQPELSRALAEQAASPAVREAVTWQNREAARNVLDRLDAVSPWNAQTRRRELTLASYLQRYCLKNDTIGFFGPIGWAWLSDGPHSVLVRPGTGLLSSRRTCFEGWAVDALAERTGRLPGVLPWLVPRRPASHLLRGSLVARPRRAAVVLAERERALLLRCDGRRTVAEVLADLDGQPDDLLRLTDLADRGLLRLDLLGPAESQPEHTLRRRLEAIGDPGLRERALAPLKRLCALRDEVSAAAGDATRLGEALDRLSAGFESATGAAATRRAGTMYAGRTLIYEDAVRDVDVQVGAGLLDAAAGPLGLVLDSADWLVRRVADNYRAVFAELLGNRRAAADGMPLARLFALAADRLTVGARSVPPPVAEAVAELQRRWSQVLGPAAEGPEQRPRWSSAELADRVARAFPPGPLPWAAAAHHSPDLMVHAADRLALARGEFLLVLGEVHPAINSLDQPAFVAHHHAPERLLARAEADYAGRRIYAVQPKESPFVTSRMAPPAGLLSPDYRYWTWSEGQDSVEGPGTVLPAAGLTAYQAADGALLVRGPDGGDLDLLEVLGEFLCAAVSGAFGLLAPVAHRPRITVDRMVLCRETWRIPLAELAWTRVKDVRRRFLAARAWRAELGLPERAFWKVPYEVKPVAVDFTSPVLVELLAKAVRGAPPEEAAKHLTVGEMLPDLDGLWLPDAQDRRYTSEFRLVLTRGPAAVGDPAH